MKQIESLKMKLFFNYLWATRSRVSEVSNARFGDQPLSIYYHHVFEKSCYPELAYATSNILRVTSDEHANLNFDSDYYEESVLKKKRIEENWSSVVEESRAMEERIENIIKKADLWHT